ncbi:endonuclease domain-containing protein [Methylobacterium sp. JK268]
MAADPRALRPDGIAPRVAALAPGQRLVLTGIGGKGLREILAASPGLERSVLFLAPRPAPNADSVLDRILDDLASLALTLWPHWPANEAPPVSGPWRKAAAKCAAAGTVPRFRRCARAFELTQLLRVVDPAGVILAAEIDPVAPGRAAPVIAALEGGLAHGAACLLACPAVPPDLPPYDRILYGAEPVAPAAEPVEARFLAPSRAHWASATERRLEEALRRDPEIGPLFSGNETVDLPGYGAPRVDLLWRAGRIVVELDGTEHRGAARFAEDRHRDYELLVAGYLVLRLTNRQVETDLQRAIEKIRAVVRFRRSQGGLSG